MEVRIRSFGVGLIALAAVTAASLLLRRRRILLKAAQRNLDLNQVHELYAAGM